MTSSSPSTTFDPSSPTLIRSSPLSPISTHISSTSRVCSSCHSTPLSRTQCLEECEHRQPSTRSTRTNHHLVDDNF
ncbi:hypothetical protein JHK82_018996 [Glycine max]|uniref:Uncharacterized protein n=2 Tax=Glycine subgen. Soja TaxID=1462606 RepID=K7L2D5_SOYBN|nr:hypothetical protein JHK87_018867 [Glycine soja]KAG5023091.1 hypothetical protein JHK85_019433 [Glycine max]KAG5038175.1 hypothetical protein JHK86_019015 [Glycine max]KAG5143301.1 hypothetical protein JHK82_018996 [Glycine max]KAH1087323.1 hypothetical protein GYH30_018738 [Glycine max]